MPTLNDLAVNGTINTINQSYNKTVHGSLTGVCLISWCSAGPMVWVQQQMMSGKDPLPILKSLIPDDTHIPAGLDELTLWKIIINILSEPPKRSKLSHVNSLDDIVHLLQTCKNVMVLTGAGVGVLID